MNNDNLKFKTEVIDKYLNDIYALVFHLVGKHSDAEDIVQESLLRALKYYPSLKDKTKLKTWIFTIVYNVYKNWVRYRVTHKINVNVSIEDVQEFEQNDNTVLHGQQLVEDEPEKVMVDADKLRKIIYTAIHHLSPLDRFIAILCEVENKQYKEIAEILKMPIGTVKCKIFLYRKKLREILLPKLKKVDGIEDIIK